ncbi:MAG: ECF transporter S component [Ruminococcaceae bacterium]|nr:ECF transporter S component [Oscillospiraceae bacterium]
MKGRKVMQNRFKTSATIRRMVIIAMFCAMSYVAMLLIHIKVGFLTLDVKDAVIALCGLYFGPLSALFIAVLVPFLELVTVSTTGYYGLIMNILGSVSFSLTASLVYKYKKTLWGAIVGLVSAGVVTVAVMLLANLFITPYYMGVTVDAVRGMIPTLLLPFNLLKAVCNVGIVLLLYKSMSRALRRAGFLPRSAKVLPEGNQAPVQKPQNRKTTLVISLVALLLIVAAMVLIFTVFEGKFEFGIK